MSAYIGVLLEALTFVHMLTLVQGSRQVSVSVQFSQTASILYIPIDNTYKMDIFTIYYLKICCSSIPILIFLLQIFCLSSFIFPTVSNRPIFLY